MAVRTTRRARDKVGVYVELDPALKELMDRYAATAGQPLWWVVDKALRTAQELEGANGLPVDWESQQPSLVDAAAGRGKPAAGRHQPVLVEGDELLSA